MEFKMRLGMTTLTWASMNIDAFIRHVLSGLRQLRDLVCSINDIIEHRIENNLRVVSRARLIDLPHNASFTVSDFLSIQRSHIMSRAVMLQNKNIEVEKAVDDLVIQIRSYEFDSPHVYINEEDILKLKEHYNQFMYQALLHSAKNSMNSLKKRIGSRGNNIINSSRPFFEVNVQLIPPFVSLSPSLDDIQDCINQFAQTILSCYKNVIDWKHRRDNMNDVSRHHTFFERITKDIELVRVALLLTGCIQGIRNTVSDYLSSFSKV
jgi:dynein heavy chain